MRTLIQRVNHASVMIENETKSEIGKGMLILLGIEEEDNHEDIRWLSNKVSQLRIFDDEQGQMNLSVKDINGEVLVISQFTLHANTRKGTRPSYTRAAKPDTAIPLYNQFIEQMGKETNQKVKSGEFGAYMKITLENDGPATIMIDSKNKKL